MGADEEELEALVAFLRWIDQDEVKDQIEALLQGTLNDAVLQYMKDNPQQTKKDRESEGLPAWDADVEDEPPVAEPEQREDDERQIAENQLQELYKRWSKMIK